MTDLLQEPTGEPVEGILPMPDPARVEPSKPFLTVVERIVHAGVGIEATEVSSAYQAPLSTREQVYRRNVTFDQGWRPLDLGWVGDRCSLVHLSNREGERYETIPTAEERADVEGRVIEIGVVVTEAGRDATQWDAPTTVIVPLFAVLPRESMRFCPAGPTDRLRVRCVLGTARATLVAFPS